jgi:hypothetical protein
MSKLISFSFMVILYSFSLVSCNYEISMLSEQKVRDLAWKALNPYTLSHNRDAWEVIEIRKVFWKDISDQFTSGYYYGCRTKTTQESDRPIDLSKVYWYVHMEPRPVTPLPPRRNEPVGTGNPPIKPEMNIENALFLIDPDNGQIIARRLGCIVY